MYLLPAVNKGFVSPDELLELFETCHSAFPCKMYSLCYLVSDCLLSSIQRGNIYKVTFCEMKETESAVELSNHLFLGVFLFFN